MGQRLAGKTTIVTGASSGIGLAAAQLFASEGANVLIAARRPDALADARAAIVEVSGNDRVEAVPADVSKGTGQPSGDLAMATAQQSAQ